MTYGYDAAEHLVTATDWSRHTATYSYDAVGNVVTLALPNGVATTYKYDAVGNLVYFNPGNQQQFYYDASGYLTGGKIPSWWHGSTDQSNTLLATFPDTIIEGLRNYTGLDDDNISEALKSLIKHQGNK